MRCGKVSRRRFLLYSFLGGPLLACADGYWIEPGWVKVRRLRLAENRPAHRLVHITDIHHKGDKTFLESVVGKINALAPDLVCFTGDLIEEAKHLPEALALLSQIKAPLYGVPGNHDYWAKTGFGSMKAAFAKTGGAWLMDDQAISADGKICITGITVSRWTKQKVRPPRPGCKNVMLMHYPLFVEELPPHRFDLVLAGHSHGGQFRLPFYGAVINMMGVGKYEIGLFDTKAGPLYVNPGLGWFATPIRFNCRPEITVIEL